MRNIAIAAVVLVIILSLGILDQIYIRNTFGKFDERLGDISQMVEKDDIGSAADAAKETEEWWNSRLKLLEILSHNRDLSNITQEVSKLRGFLLIKNKERAQVSLHTLSVMSVNLQYVLKFRVEHLA